MKPTGKVRDGLATALARAVPYLRWMIPLLAVWLAFGHIVSEQGTTLAYSMLQPSNLLIIALAGVILPGLVWLASTCVEQATRNAAQMQRDLAFRNRELAVLNAIGEATAPSLDVDEIPQMAVAKMTELLNLDAVDLRLLEGDRMVLKAHRGVSGNFVTAEKIADVGHCLCGRCAKTGQIQLQKAIHGEPSLASSPCASEGFNSSLSVPMKSKGSVVGVIHVASRNTNAFSQSDQQTLAAVASRVATAIENSTLYKREKRHAIQLETTSLIGQHMTALLEPNRLLSEVVRQVREKFGYFHVGILLVEPEAGQLVPKESSGRNAELVKAEGLRLEIGDQSIEGRVAHTGQAFLCNDVSRETRYRRTNALGDTRAELAVPMRARNRVIGVLDVRSDRVNAFGKEDITILQILANQVGIALENAHLFQETRQRYAAMVTLHQFSLDMISELDRHELLEALLRRSVELVGAHAAALFQYDPAADSISCIASYNSDRDWKGITLRPGEAVIGRVIQTGKPLFVNDIENWEGRAAALGPPFAHTRILGVPLTWQGRVVGGMVLMNESRGRPFGENDLWLSRLYVDLASIALKNAELHTRVKQFNQDLEAQVVSRTQELERAKEEISAKAHELRSLLAKTVRLQEEEQARIARDLHDGIIQMVTASKYEIQAARLAAGETLAASAHARLDAARELLDEMQREIRRTIYDLHPAMLDSLGLIPALEKYIARFQQVSGIPCDLQTMGTPRRLPPQTEIALYRLVEEALQNIATHARASAATLVLAFEPSALSVTIQDDGQGFDYRQWCHGSNGKHIGLLAMQERVSSLAGKMKVSSELGKGTRLIFHLPLGACR